MAKGITFFKPNARNAGFLFSFNFGPSKSGTGLKGELSLYVSSVAQASWNPTTKTGSFSANSQNPAKSINVKLNEFEAGAIINSIRRLTEWKGFHSHPGSKDKVQLSFSPAVQDEIVKGFFFSLMRNSTDKFTLAISLGECEALATYLDFGLKTLYSNRFRLQFGGQEGQQTEAPAAPAAPTRQQQASQPAQEENPFEQGETQEEAPPQEEEGDQNPFR